MVEVQKQTKNLQENINGALYIYLDKKLMNLLGLKPKEPVEVVYDLEAKEVRVHQSSLCSSQEASKV